MSPQSHPGDAMQGSGAVCQPHRQLEQIAARRVILAAQLQRTPSSQPTQPPRT